MNEPLAELQIAHGVMMTVQRLTEQHETKFHREPQYVIIPESIYPLIRVSLATVLREDADARDKPIELFMGLIVCPTPSIKTIDEIEVF